MLRLLLPSLLLAFISLPSNSPSFIHNDDDNNNSSDSSNPIEACNPLNHPNPLALESDRLTVLITGYSPSRIPRLLSLALSYSAHPPSVRAKSSSSGANRLFLPTSRPLSRPPADRILLLAPSSYPLLPCSSEPWAPPASRTRVPSCRHIPTTDV
ncbi:uncharacterized protein A4U43_C05F7860 [Asparagus officinalis]|uniref:Uncharacterized protein n=1 Tax=Asparagus officinalis TaxID=4686 RepID=A0A5P1EVJ9_ASPOF|nr:uncharacterized protein A4U43_C05F7860 [Asparagus officinalis]